MDTQNKTQRTIKFRAWHSGTSRMWEPFTLIDISSASPYCDGADECFEMAYEYLEIMQYTGLKDKNGKEIYEGDILRDDFSTKLVEWKDDLYSCGCCGDHFFGVGLMHADKDTEVIGNIYENPELIEK